MTARSIRRPRRIDMGEVVLMRTLALFNAK